MTARLGHSEIGEERFNAQAIALRVQELGEQLSRAYAGRRPLFVGMLQTAVPFLADLTRSVTIPCAIECMAVDSEHGPSGLRIEKDLASSIEGRDVLLIEGITQTGATLAYAAESLRRRSPASLALCTLVDRPAVRTAELNLAYRGFVASDDYLVGYGLGKDGRYRELPAIYVLGARS